MVGRRSETDRVQRATERVEWNESKQKRSADNEVGALVFGVLLLAVLGALLAAGIDTFDRALSSKLVWNTYSGGLLCLLLLASGWRAITLQQFRRRFRDERLARRAVEELQAEERRIAEDATNGNIDLASLWRVNQQRIDHYHEIAINQSRRSFGILQGALICGFILLIAVGVSASFAEKLSASVAAGVIGLLGATLSGFVTATFMRSQVSASEQLESFFGQPVEFARILAAERLISSTLDMSDRPEAVMLVIKHMTAAGVKNNLDAGNG